MNIQALKDLTCPICQDNGDLQLHNIDEHRENLNWIEQGVLYCNNAHLFPVLGGIPRLLPDSWQEFSHNIDSTKLPERFKASYFNQGPSIKPHYLETKASFSSEWNEVGEFGHAWGQTSQDRLEMLCQFFNVPRAFFADKKVLDVGSGHGEVVEAFLLGEAEVYGIELSSSVDLIQNKLKRMGIQISRINLFQADAHNLPFKYEKFDICHSAGVLHHTFSTENGFYSLSKRLKKSGLAFIEVYSKDHKNAIELIYFYLFQAVRRITLLLPHPMLHFICYLLSPLQMVAVFFLNLISKQSRYVVRNLKETELSLFDTFSPRYDWHHSSEEVKEWFEKVPCKEIKKTLANHNVIGFVGIKS